MNVRQFQLINKNGIEYNLTVRSHFLHSPEGLGFTRDSIFQRAGNVFKRISTKFVQPQVTGEVFFPDPKAYDKYFEFMQFTGYGELTILYKPSQKTYRATCELSEVQKTEKQACGLNVKVVLSLTSLWYEIVSAFNDSTSVEGGKIYDYTYDYTYEDNITNSVSFDSDTYIDSPLKIYIYGLAVNPIWRYYNNNVLVGTGKVNGTIPQGNLLLIDTTVIPYQIKQLDSMLNEVSDMYALSDFSSERFFHMRYGNNRISVAHDGTSPIKVRTETQLLYASV